MSRIQSGGSNGAMAALRALSARIGADPSLVQGPGGNTSLKADGVLRIKASGTWLSQAQEAEIFVPVPLEPLLEAVARKDPAAETPHVFVTAASDPSGLRPSIEMTVHAVIPQRVVVHVHCVETIALGVRQDAQSRLAERLAGMDWILVPYVRPGLPLARAIAAALGPRTDVIVLGNHGLVVAAGTVAEAEALLGAVCARLASPVRAAQAPDLDGLGRLAAGSGYGLPAAVEAHAAACDPASTAIAATGSLYPDHVIFLGTGSVVAEGDASPAAVAADHAAAGLPPPVSILCPGRGVLMRKDASTGAQAMARCLADVTARIPAEAPLRYFTDTENAALLDWDAEQYRRALDAARP